jgi:hypothetical protein
MRQGAVEVKGGEQEGKLTSNQARDYSNQDVRHGLTLPYRTEVYE